MYLQILLIEHKVVIVKLLGLDGSSIHVYYAITEVRERARALMTFDDNLG